MVERPVEPERLESREVSQTEGLEDERNVPIADVF